MKPIQPGETIKVRLTAKDKSPRNKQYGEVRWDVEIMTDKGETAATYESTDDERGPGVNRIGQHSKTRA